MIYKNSFKKGKLLFFSSLIVVFLNSFLQASVEQVLVADKRYSKQDIRNAKKELETATDHDYRESIKTHIKGLQAIVNALSCDEPKPRRRLPRPRRRLPRPPSRQYLSFYLLWHEHLNRHQDFYTYNNSDDVDNSFTTPPRRSPENQGPPPVRIQRRILRYAGRHSVSDQQEGVRLAQPNEEEVFL